MVLEADDDGPAASAASLSARSAPRSSRSLPTLSRPALPPLPKSPPLKSERQSPIYHPRVQSPGTKSTHSPSARSVLSADEHSVGDGMPGLQGWSKSPSGQSVASADDVNPRATRPRGIGSRLGLTVDKPRPPDGTPGLAFSRSAGSLQVRRAKPSPDKPATPEADRSSGGPVRPERPSEERPKFVRHRSPGSAEALRIGSPAPSEGPSAFVRHRSSGSVEGPKVDKPATPERPPAIGRHGSSGSLGSQQPEKAPPDDSQLFVRRRSPGTRVLGSAGASEKPSVPAERRASPAKSAPSRIPPAPEGLREKPSTPEERREALSRRRGTQSLTAEKPSTPELPPSCSPGRTAHGRATPLEGGSGATPATPDPAPDAARPRSLRKSGSTASLLEGAPAPKPAPPQSIPKPQPPPRTPPESLLRHGSAGNLIRSRQASPVIPPVERSSSVTSIETMSLTSKPSTPTDDVLRLMTPPTMKPPTADGRIAWADPPPAARPPTPPDGQLAAAPEPPLAKKPATPTELPGPFVRHRGLASRADIHGRNGLRLSRSDTALSRPGTAGSSTPASSLGSPAASPDVSPDPSPECSPTSASTSLSSSSRPRTPRSVEVRVEGQEVSVPKGTWTPDGHLEAASGEATCTVTVTTGLTGKNGVHVVLRVGLEVHDKTINFKPSVESLGSWASARVTGRAECDIGRLSSRSTGTSPRIPTPGACRHQWSETRDPPDADGGEKPMDEVTAKEVLAMGVATCQASFTCGLEINASAACVLQEDGKASLRVDVEGELRVRPWFQTLGRSIAAELYKEARGHFCAGQDQQALEKCERAIVLVQSLTPVPREVGDVLNLLGALHLRRGTPGPAVECLRLALAARAKHRQEAGAVAAEDATMAATLSSLGRAYQALGCYDEALQCHERTVGILEHTAGSEGAAYGTALQSLGDAHRALRHHDQARGCYERVLAIRDRTLGTEHPLHIVTLNNLGAVLQHVSDYRGAIRIYHRALAILTKLYGPKHSMTIGTLGNLGCAHAQAGEYQCAVECHTRVLSVQEEALGHEHPSVAATLHNLGNALAAGSRGHDAARCHWRALAIWSQALGPSNPDVAATLHSLGNVYRGLSERQAAAECLAGALRIREAVLGPTHPDTARTRHCAALVGCTPTNCYMALQDIQNVANTLLSTVGAKHPWSLQAQADAETLRQAIG